MTQDAQAMRVVSEFYNEPVSPCLAAVDAKYAATRETLIGAYETVSKNANVLLVSNFLSHIELFPDTVSQVWTDGEEVYASEGFNNTAATRIVRCTERMSGERLARIKAKYSDFSFTQFDDFGEWAI
jgi:hypothetical protein